MKRKGVCYDAGRVMAGNWRPEFDPKVVHRELEIIKNDLHCNAVRICALDIDHLMTAAEYALTLGLEVWLSPEMWDRSADETHAYIAKAAAGLFKRRGVCGSAAPYCPDVNTCFFDQTFCRRVRASPVDALAKGIGVMPPTR